MEPYNKLSATLHLYSKASIATRTNGIFYYLLNDHLGSANVVVTRDNGVISQRQRFLPFGGTRTTAGSDFAGRGYTGHLHNDGVGLIYMNARYYVPALGRFASADIRIPDFVNPQAFNRYAYTVNNPIRLVDPSGHLFWDVVDFAFFAKSAYDFYHEPSWGNAGWLALDTVSLIPVVPSVGWIKYGDEAVEVAARVVNQVSDAGQAANQAVNTAQAANQAVNAAQELQILSSFAKYGDEVGSGHQLIHASDWRQAEQQLQTLLGANKQTFYASDIPSMSINTYRRPDMVGMSFIGDSKFYTTSTLGGTRIDSQIRDYMRIAEQEGKAFHLFVHVDTVVSEGIIKLVGEENIYRVFTGL